MVVALMQAQSDRPVKTFSIGFGEKAHDEARHAKAVAQHLGTDYTELYVTPKEAMAVIPKLPEIWDELFGDSSQIQTYLASQLARRHVTLSLSGDGGEELFCGYSRYVIGQSVWQKIRVLPALFRQVLSYALACSPEKELDRLMQFLPQGLSEPVPIRQMWDEHKSGKRHWRYYLWDVLMFQAGLAEQ